MQLETTQSKRLLDEFFYIISRAMLVTVFLVYAALSALSYFDYFEPYLYPLHIAQGTVSSVGKNIFLGPYPRHEELKELKMRYKVDIVISLLDVSLPQERALYEREKEESRELGLTVVNFPMNYWSLAAGVHINANEQMLDQLIGFIKANPNKKFYIHCYLGRHRVGFVKKNLVKRYIAAAQQ
jgi:hypothetical protein